MPSDDDFECVILDEASEPEQACAAAPGDGVGRRASRRPARAPNTLPFPSSARHSSTPQSKQQCVEVRSEKHSVEVRSAKHPVEVRSAKQSSCVADSGRVDGRGEGKAVAADPSAAASRASTGLTQASVRDELGETCSTAPRPPGPLVIDLTGEDEADEEGTTPTHFTQSLVRPRPTPRAPSGLGFGAGRSAGPVAASVAKLGSANYSSDCGHGAKIGSGQDAKPKIAVDVDEEVAPPPAIKLAEHQRRLFGVEAAVEAASGGMDLMSVGNGAGEGEEEDVSGVSEAATWASSREHQGVSTPSLPDRGLAAMSVNKESARSPASAGGGGGAGGAFDVRPRAGTQGGLGMLPEVAGLLMGPEDDFDEQMRQAIALSLQTMGTDPGGPPPNSDGDDAAGVRPSSQAPHTDPFATLTAQTRPATRARPRAVGIVIREPGPSPPRLRSPGPGLGPLPAHLQAIMGANLLSQAFKHPPHARANGGGDPGPGRSAAICVGKGKGLMWMLPDAPPKLFPRRQPWEVVHVRTARGGIEWGRVVDVDRTGGYRVELRGATETVADRNVWRAFFLGAAALWRDPHGDLHQVDVVDYTIQQPRAWPSGYGSDVSGDGGGGYVDAGEGEVRYEVRLSDGSHATAAPADLHPLTNCHQASCSSDTTVRPCFNSFHITLDPDASVAKRAAQVRARPATGEEVESGPRFRSAEAEDRCSPRRVLGPKRKLSVESPEAKAGNSGAVLGPRRTRPGGLGRLPRRVTRARTADSAPAAPATRGASGVADGRSAATDPADGPRGGWGGSVHGRARTAGKRPAPSKGDYGCDTDDDADLLCVDLSAAGIRSAFDN